MKFIPLRNASLVFMAIGILMLICNLFPDLMGWMLTNNPAFNGDVDDYTKAFRAVSIIFYLVGLVMWTIANLMKLQYRAEIVLKMGLSFEQAGYVVNREDDVSYNPLHLTIFMAFIFILFMIATA